MCVFLETILNIAEDNEHPCCLKSLKPCLKKSESMAKLLWKHKRKSKKGRGKTVWCLWTVYTIPRGSSEVYEMAQWEVKDRDLFWDNRGSVSPTALTLQWPRMLKGWQIVRGWREGVYDFIKESDNKIKQRLQGCERGWPYLTTYDSTAAPQNTSPETAYFWVTGQSRSDIFLRGKNRRSQ